VLRSPTASARWLWADFKHVLGATERVSIREGWSLICHPAAYRSAYRAQVTDPEQIEEFDGFIRVCRPGMVLFDLGAHFGLFSLAAIHYGGRTARAIAVDPSPTAERILKIQARLNCVQSQLRVVRVSMSDRVGWEDLVAAGTIADGYFVPPGTGHGRTEVTHTRATTIDQLTADANVRPTHIKIDVEGLEAAVLRGGRQLLSSPQAPLLFVELHNWIVTQRQRDPAEAVGLLREYGYEILAPNGLVLRDDDILTAPLVRVHARKPDPTSDHKNPAVCMHGRHT
jgi:FkbM family methyltransferase